MSEHINSRFETLENQISSIVGGMGELQTFMRFMMNAESSGETSESTSTCESHDIPTLTVEKSTVVGGEFETEEIVSDHSYSVPINNVPADSATIEIPASSVPEHTDNPSYAERLAKYSHTEELGPAVKEGLADFVNKTITTRLEPKKYKTICEKYLRPSNTDFLVCPRVNKELWSFISKDAPKAADLEIQDLQKDYVKGLLPIVQAMNCMTEGTREWNFLADAFEIFAHQFMGLNDKRRNLLKSASSLPKKLFSHEIQITSQLFGDHFENEIQKLDLDKKNLWTLFKFLSSHQTKFGDSEEVVAQRGGPTVESDLVVPTPHLKTLKRKHASSQLF